MKILMTGSSGLGGTALGSVLARAGHTVCRLVRPQSSANEGAKEGFGGGGNPATGELGGAGGRLGSGKQWMSWVTLDDAVGILRFAIENALVRGATNVVSPQPLQNAEFTSVLAKTMHRPALFPAPAFALRLALGEMADALLLSSQRVLAQVLEKTGYQFVHSDLSAALKNLV